MTYKFRQSTHTAFIAMGSILAAACGSSDADTAYETDDDPQPTTQQPAVTSGAAAPTVDTLQVAALEAQGAGDPSTRGTVTLFSDPHGQVVTLSIVADGLAPGDHAWHIHQGSCEEAGPIRIPLSAAPGLEGDVGPLTVEDERHAEREVEVDGLTPTAVGRRQHSLHLHLGYGEDPGPSVACAEV
jgi:Cu/Zn superoxide dismutase